MPQTKTILLIQASSGGDDQRIDEEFREIQKAIGRPDLQDKFPLQIHTAADAPLLSKALLEHNPYILHISCGEGVSMFGSQSSVSPADLANLLKLFKASLKCVFISARNAGPYIVELSSIFDHVLDIREGLDPVRFSTAFYEAVGNGRELDFAAEFAAAAAGLEKVKEKPSPVPLISTPNFSRYPISPNYYLECNRHEAKGALLELMGSPPARPKTLIAYGPACENPISLGKRLLHELNRHFEGQQTSFFSTHLEGCPEIPETYSERALQGEMLQYLQASSAQEWVNSLKQPVGITFLRIKWGKQSERLLKWYVEQFWNINPSLHKKDIYLIIKLIHPSGQQGRRGMFASDPAKEAEKMLGKLQSDYIRPIALRPVPHSDIQLLLEKHQIKTQDKLDYLKGKHDPLPMEDVELWLRQFAQ